jgi:probable HAF family extracellular repeat protein
MRSKVLAWIAGMGLFALLPLCVRVVAQEGQQPKTDFPPHYAVTDLGPMASPFSQATIVNDRGLVTGLELAPDGTQHAVLWYKGLMTDISKPGLGGPNSGAGGVNEFGQVIGGAETSQKDPNNENFCGYGTGLQCLAFLWQNGVMIPLPTLGGTNSGYGQINNRGEVAGYAENGNREMEGCAVALNGTGPQVLDFEPVIWGPRPGEIRELPRLPGDKVGVAFWINDYGQAVGMSGLCANTVLPGPSAAPHAVLWDSDGSVHDLGNLGGTSNPAVLGAGNVAFVINNRGQVTGVSALPESMSTECPGVPLNPACFPFHPFLWTRETGMRDLGVLPGDLVGAGLGMNNLGEVVGPSFTAPGAATGNPSAFLWRNGVMTDLNTLVPADSPLYLLIAYGINDAGQIAGFGVNTTTGDVHGFLATPCDANHADTEWCKDDAERAAAEGDVTTERPKPALSENARIQLQKLMRFRLPGAPPTEPQ